MPNQSLVDLTQRTATADTDLIHVNSGGSDYKQAKSNFTADLATNVSFNNTSTLESQILALGNTSHVYTGYIESYGHQTETGVPQNTNFFVTVYVKDASHKRVLIRRAISGNEAYTKYYGGSSVGWSDWVQEPSRSEISALNNGLTKYYDAPAISSVSIGQGGYVELDKPSSMQGKHLLAISVINYGNAGGTFYVAIAKDTTNRFFIYGTPNITITNLELRWVYTD